MSEVRIERLVLELPGMTAEAARALALGVAEGLAGAAVSGDFDTVEVTLDPAQGAEATPGLAAAIVTRLLQRIG